MELRGAEMLLKMEKLNVQVEWEGEGVVDFIWKVCTSPQKRGHMLDSLIKTVIV